MKKIFEKILVSAIYTAKNNGPMSDIWKFQSNFTFATAIASNILLIFMLVNVHFFPGSLDFMLIKITGVGNIDFVIRTVGCIIGPIMLYNHFNFYKDDRYEMIVTKYQKWYRKLPFAVYFLCSFAAPIIFVLSQVEIR